MIVSQAFCNDLMGLYIERQAPSNVYNRGPPLNPEIEFGTSRSRLLYLYCSVTVRHISTTSKLAIPTILALFQSL